MVSRSRANSGVGRLGKLIYIETIAAGKTLPGRLFCIQVNSSNAFDRAWCLKENGKRECFDDFSRRTLFKRAALVQKRPLIYADS